VRVLVFAPNGGASLSTGGGTRVALAHAEILSRAGHEVALAGFHAAPREILGGWHGLVLPPSIRILSDPSAHRLEFGRRLPLKLSAYNLLLGGAFRHWVDQVFLGFRPEAVWFHDDIPEAARPWLVGRRVHAYVHYPFAGRDPEIVPALRTSRSRAEAWNDQLLRGLGPVCSDPSALCEAVWANSTVTARTVRMLWGETPDVVAPFLGPGQFSDGLGPKENLVLAVGTFSRGKGHDELLEAFDRAAPDGWALQLVGHARDGAYVRRLAARARRMNARGRTTRLVTDASAPQLAAAYARATVLVHAATFEPFGLAVLEAMAQSVVPLVREGPYSGPWVDILDHGRFGMGFHSVDDLAVRLRDYGQRPVEADARCARTRARRFSADETTRRMLELLPAVPVAS
jgi:glycosyltransferase involved in cell wall biosynthesis